MASSARSAPELSQTRARQTRLIDYTAPVAKAGVYDMAGQVAQIWAVGTTVVWTVWPCS
jgi:hypothetical protein